MAIYAYVRYSGLKNDMRAQSQTAEMARKAEELGGSLIKIFVDPGPSDRKTAILDRPTGKEMLGTLRAGDTLLVNRLDRLGCSMRDIKRTMDALANREVRIYVLHDRLDMSPGFSEAMVGVFDIWAHTERVLRSERATDLMQKRKEDGLAYGGVPIGKKIVERKGRKVLEWDMDQLAHIAEIAKRLPVEGAAKVAEDFWKRGIKDRRGRPWGQQTPRTKLRALAMFQMLVAGRRSYASPYKQFHRAATWFHRMKHKDQLPPPYGELALSIAEPKGFREEPKPKKWTRGGTAKREQERADSRAKTRAERQARWERKKKERIQSRVHKPQVELWLKEGEQEHEC